MEFIIKKEGPSREDCKSRKENVAVCKSQGYDEFYVLPGKIEQDSSEIEVAQGASKAALKRAFSKSANGRLKNRPLLNKFISMVA